MNVFISTCCQGLIYAILSLGVYITFRILNFADMTAEGAFALGGSICGVLMASGVDAFSSVLIAALVGSLAGLITGILNTRLKIQDILSGILTMISLYSINLRIMGKANVSLLGKSTVFKFFSNSMYSAFGMVLIFCVFIIFILDLFFKTRIGLAIRATGDNEQMMRALGGNTNFKKILALMLSASLCAISGALVAQNQGYADVNMGTGTIVIAFASIVIGESFYKKSSVLMKLIFTVLGSVCYRFIILMVLNLGMNPSDLKLFTALTSAVLLSFPVLKKRFLGGIKNAKNKKFKKDF